MSIDARARTFPRVDVKVVLWNFTGGTYGMKSVPLYNTCPLAELIVSSTGIQWNHYKYDY